MAPSCEVLQKYIILYVCNSIFIYCFLYDLLKKKTLRKTHTLLTLFFLISRPVFDCIPRHKGDSHPKAVNSLVISP